MEINTNSTAVAGPLVVESSFWTARSSVSIAMSFVASSGQWSFSFRRGWVDLSFYSEETISL